MVAEGAQQEPRRVCCSRALLQHIGGKTILQKRRERGGCLFMGTEYLVARERLREVSMVPESNMCLLKFCLQFIWVRYSNNTLLYSLCW